MIVSIHQPNFMPWRGFFDKISESDIFVILDDSQFEKNSFLNRNKIKTANGAQWLTLPVKGSMHDKINETLIDNTKNWKKDHLRTIELAYKKSKNFSNIFSVIEKIYNSKEWIKMADFNLAIIFYMVEFLQIKNKKIMLSSELNVGGNSSELLLNIVKKVGGDHYLSGLKGRDYLDENIFKENNIKVTYQDYHEETYKQSWGKFIPNLSALDYIFNI